MSRHRIGYEVFAENERTFQQCKFNANGFTYFENELRPCLWRASLQLVRGGVEWELLAHLHARHVATFTDESGAQIVQLVGIGAQGRPFTLETTARDYERGTSRFWGRLYSAAGIGSIIYPGKRPAVLRAIKALSAEDAEQEVTNDVSSDSDSGNP